MRVYLLTALLIAGALLTAPHAFGADDANSLIGVVTEAPASSKWAGGQVTFTGLTTALPTAIWPDGYDARLAKAFESADLLVLQYVGAVGSIDTAYIEKKNKRFLVVSVGALGVSAKDAAAISVSVYRGYIK